MLRFDHSSVVLDGLFRKKINAAESGEYPEEWVYDIKPIKFPTGNDNEDYTKIYIGLFTTNPLPDGTDFVEPGPNTASLAAPETWREYTRIRLNTRSRLKKVPFLNGAQVRTDTETYNDPVKVAYVNNGDMILFPEAVGSSENTNGWGKVTGFGLFYEKEVLKDIAPQTDITFTKVDTETYTSEFSGKLNYTVGQGYIFSWKENKNDVSKEEEHKYYCRLVSIDKKLYFGNVSLLGLEAPDMGWDAEVNDAPFVGEVKDGKLLLTAPKSSFAGKNNSGAPAANESPIVTISVQEYNLPFLWGTISNEFSSEGVVVEQYQVPVIREGGFVVSLV